MKNIKKIKIIDEVQISELGLGCWALGGLNFVEGIDSGWAPVDYAEAKSAILYALENGINHFDTADSYGNGLSEKYLGNILDEIGKTNSVFISTKVGFLKNNFQHSYSAENIKLQFANSLKNLRRDYVDIYYFHHSDFGENDCYLDDALKIFNDLKAEGKIKAIGLSCYKTKDFVRLISKIKPDVIQGKANLLDTKFIEENSIVAQLVKKNDIKFVAFSPFEHGILLNKYKNDIFFQDGDHRKNLKKFKPENLQIINKKLDILAEMFGDKPEDFSSICLNFLFGHEIVSNVLVGFRNKQQVEMNLEYLKSKENFSRENLKNLKFIKNLFRRK
jgi:aryl-alcohol dehydrogenase-like predicted oxidoreductase